MSNSRCDLRLDCLERDTKPQDGWPELVFAAFAGEAAVDALLRTAPNAQPQPAPAKTQDRARKASQTAYRPTVDDLPGTARTCTVDLVVEASITLVFGHSVIPIPVGSADPTVDAITAARSGVRPTAGDHASDSCHLVTGANAS
jgi:hypothetical protein